MFNKVYCVFRGVGIRQDRVLNGIKSMIQNKYLSNKKIWGKILAFQLKCGPKNLFSIGLIFWHILNGYDVK